MTKKIKVKIINNQILVASDNKTCIYISNITETGFTINLEPIEKTNNVKQDSYALGDENISCPTCGMSWCEC